MSLGKKKSIQVQQMDGSPVHTSSCAPWLKRGEDEGDDKKTRWEEPRNV